MIERCKGFTAEKLTARINHLVAQSADGYLIERLQQILVLLKQQEDIRSQITMLSADISETNFR